MARVTRAKAEKMLADAQIDRYRAQTALDAFVKRHGWTAPFDQMRWTDVDRKRYLLVDQHLRAVEIEDAMQCILAIVKARDADASRPP